MTPWLPNTWKSPTLKEEAMISHEHLKAAASRAKALASELGNMYICLCSPQGTPIPAKDISDLAADVTKVSERLAELAEEWQNRSASQEGRKRP